MDPSRASEAGAHREAASLRSFFEGPLYPWATALLVLLCIVPALATFPIHRDIASHLDVVWRMLHGEVLYRDIGEVNPPLVFYLFVPPVALTRLLPFRDFEIVRPYILALLGLLVAVAMRTAEAVGLPASHASRRLFLWLLLYAAFSFRAIEIGEREGLMAFLVLPYLLGSAAFLNGRRLPRGLAVVAGLLAGVGFGLKPYFVAVWLAVEAYLLIATPSRRLASLFSRLESWCVAAFLAAYAAWVLLGTAYVTSIPMIRFGYRAYEHGLLEEFFSVSPGFSLGALVVFLLLERRARDVERPLRIVLLLAIAGTLLSALVQMKGWSHQTIAEQVFSILAIGLGAFLILQPAGPRPRVHGAAAALVFALAGANAVDALRHPELLRADEVRTIAREVQELAPGGRVAWISNTNYPAYPSLTYAGVHQCLSWGPFPLPAIYATASHPATGRFPYHAPAERLPLERFVLDRMVEDLRRHRPALIVVDRTDDELFGPGFDYVEYFSLDPRFATILRENYERRVDLLPLTLYERKRS